MNFFDILPWIGNNMHPPLAHLTQRVIWAFVISLRPSSVRRQLLSNFSSETTLPIKTKLWWNCPWAIHFQNYVRQSRPSTTMAAVTTNKKGGCNLKIVISETTGQIGTKLCLDSPWMIPFQNFVRKSRPPSNMAIVAKNKKGGWNILFSPLKLLGQLDPSFAKIILWWSPFTILSGSPVLGARGTLLLKINDSLHIK